jgi:hypothetical protein
VKQKFEEVLLFFRVPLGRPRHILKDNIKMDVREVG